ncbi:hypothetical protein FZEAL_9820 [Fusarium zealandicum]|uniref:Saccharopine dehydrogenase-like C-terminal domain-containing protein n=1 Tax=Fusarium zealandicum TaxID=1053134 RepID=A0A8H4XER0_9HYPO|nr:hypothetical protein FZEAL_9820 [Fusarium zealandicum]
MAQKKILILGSGMVAKPPSDHLHQFSWSPRGALLSQNNSATFLRDGEVVKISNKDLMGTAKPYHVLDGYSLVAYANRDSVPFRDFYGIPEAHTVIRGSLRYEGNPSLVKALVDLGWIDAGNKPWLKPGERDLVILQHKFVVEWADGSQNTITSTLELFGDPEGYSGMSKAVGVTCGIATQMLLDGFAPLNKPGVFAPYTRDICDALRVEVEAEGIKLVDTTF